MFDESGPESAADAPPSPEPAATTEQPATTKFKSCRWYETQDNGGAAYCSHRDVLPYAGINGFKPDAWCPDCSFYKVRRTVKKRPDNQDY